ncbi:MAG: threonine--tRNA ligase [Patescibacteria group bacterium]
MKILIINLMSKQNSHSLDGIRHSLAHLLASSVIDLFPGAQNAIGPSIENGFYQDFDLPQPISEEDFPKIEAKMREKMASWKEFSRREVSVDEAKKVFAWNKYKSELIDEFAGDGKTITFYTSGDFIDLCKGGHADNMQSINPETFKLERIAGAYWRGSEKNKMLTRIYGLAFETREELDAHIKMVEEAKKRDHKKLGPELDLFVFSDLVGPGLPLWTPKGTILRNLLDDFVWQLRRARGYDRVEIPHITKKELYEKSGHWEKYKDDLFRIETREGHEFAMKPMNCPHHTQIFARKKWSYRELPQRYANTTTCYRDEQSGELSGLSRVRAFAQDDAHVFCRMAQAKEEFLKIWDIVYEFYPVFGFDLQVRLSTHDPKQPEKYLGDKKLWAKAEGVLREIVTEKKIDWIEGVGEAAFYGPKLDFMAKDAIGREWQMATIQLDMNMPERFDLSCINESGKIERIVMIHAAIMGSIERFLAVLIEHLAGAFPLWLAPTQVVILPVSDKFSQYAETLKLEIERAGFRVELGGADETLGKRIRGAEMKKIPYVLVVGEKEELARSVSVRHYKRGQDGVLSLESLIEKLQKETASRFM